MVRTATERSGMTLQFSMAHGRLPLAGYGDIAKWLLKELHSTARNTSYFAVMIILETCFFLGMRKPLDSW